MSKEEIQALVTESPLTQQMNQSIVSIGNQNTKKSKEMSKKVTQTFLRKSQTMAYQEHKIVGKHPSARDGHSLTKLSEDYFLVFGGDRHMMQYNDIFILDTQQLLEHLDLQ